VKTGIVAVSANIDYLPLSLKYLKYSLPREYLENVKLLNFNFEDDASSITEKIMSFNFDIIGFSVYVWNVKKIKEIVKIIKKFKQETKIIFGGPEVSPRPKEILEEIPECDFVVVGEGEFTFREILKNLKINNRSISKIDGVFFKDNGTIIGNNETKKIEPLDLIPSPYIEEEFDIENNFNVLPVETMRGCRYRCRFCFYSKGRNEIRFFSDERVRESLYYGLRKSSCQQVYLMDPDFTANKERLKRICSFIAEHNENKKSFHTEIRAEEVDEGIASSLKKANITDVEVGLQSTNEDVLQICSRPSNLQLVQRGILYLTQAGIKSELQLIVGLPLDTRESFLKSIDDAVLMSPTTLACFRLLVLPGTYFRTFSNELGLVFENGPPWKIIKTKTIDEEEMTRLSRTAIYASYLYSNFKLTTKFLLKELKMKHSSISNLFALDETSFEVDEPITSTKHRRIILTHIPYLIEKLCKDKGLNFNFYKSIMIKEMAFREE